MTPMPFRRVPLDDINAIRPQHYSNKYVWEQITKAHCVGASFSTCEPGIMGEGARAGGGGVLLVCAASLHHRADFGWWHGRRFRGLSWGDLGGILRGICRGSLGDLGRSGVDLGEILGGGILGGSGGILGVLGGIGDLGGSWGDLGGFLKEGFL